MHSDPLYAAINLHIKQAEFQKPIEPHFRLRY